MQFFKKILFISLVTISYMNAKVTDLIMILDPGKAETIETGMGALTGDTIIALHEKTAPIIVSSDILAIILNVKVKLGNNNLQQLRTIIQTSSDPASVMLFLSKLNIANRKDEIALISLIDFDNKNFNCYLHKSESLVLIIPKQYIQANFPNAANLSLNDQAQACGFNPANVTAINDFTAEDLLPKLQAQPSIESEKFISNLTTLFIPNKEDTKWAIYLTGHGGLAKSTQWIRDLLAQYKEQLAFQRGFSDTSSVESKIKKYEEMLATSNDTKTISTSSYVAGISLKGFAELMEFFNKKINTAFLFYTTCFSNGYNQIFVNEILSSLNVNFIVASQGVDERTTRTTFPKLIPNSSKSGLVISKQQYTDFFRLLNLFIDKPEEFVKIKGEKQEPVSQILRTIIPTINKDDQPFVRFPGVGVFEALSLDKNIKILTQSIVKAHEIEKRPIDLSNTDLNVVIIRPSRINILLNLGNKGAGHPNIVLPTPKNIPSSYETFHVFKEINFENTLQSLLFNFINLNARIHTQTFLVKNLTGINLEKSGLSTNQDTTNTIHNLIIQIKGILGTALKQPFLTSTPLTAKDIMVSQMGANIDAAFELNGNIYQGTMGIENFDAPNLLNNFTKITFTSKPMPTMDMNSLANKFLTSQEITKLKTPITLESIAQYIDSKIDQQEPSIFNQPDADNEALRKFLERSQK